MRYEDWDVLLFPDDAATPIKEFKTQCHVVQDNEFAYTYVSPGLPTMTCFMPALPAGQPFFVSVHSWSKPPISLFTQNNFGKHVEKMIFQVRVFIDGRHVASTTFTQNNLEGPQEADEPENPRPKWPVHIKFGFDFTKNGDHEQLRFPPFRDEVLRQSYWSPADDLGRIKVVISEGFDRDSETMPVERVKNIVAFSFQHAPIEILEASGIAWPNPSMWRRGGSNISLQVPIEHPSFESDLHTHSPRRRLAPFSEPQAKADNASFLESMPNTQAFLQNTTYVDPSDSQSQPYNPSADFDWTTGLVSSDFAASLTQSLLNQPLPALRKTSSAQSPASTRTFPEVFSSRSVSGNAGFGQDLTNINPVATFMGSEGNVDKVAKRSRNATPASNRALDEDEEPRRSTPHVRLGLGGDIVN